MTTEKAQKCPTTRFPDGTTCGEGGWHAGDCPAQPAPDQQLQAVLGSCDCWPETALRAAPVYAVKQETHDALCPARVLCPPGSPSDGGA